MNDKKVEDPVLVLLEQEYECKKTGKHVSHDIHQKIRNACADKEMIVVVEGRIGGMSAEVHHAQTLRAIGAHNGFYESIHEEDSDEDPNYVHRYLWRFIFLTVEDIIKAQSLITRVTIPDCTIRVFTRYN